MRKLMIIMMLVWSITLLAALRISAQIGPETRNFNTADFALLLDPGKPMLHYYKMNVLLPFGEEYSGASITWGQSVDLGKGVNIDFAKAQQPISSPEIVSQTVADASVYANNAFYPYKDYEYLGTHYYRGYAIAHFNIYPIRYNPVSKELMSYSSFNLDITTNGNAEVSEKQSRYVSLHDSSLASLKSMVKNPETIQSYSAAPKTRHTSRNLDPADAKSMIIITSDSRTLWFAEYAAWRESKGISTGIYSTEFIYANYTGVDNAEKVRNFIIDAYLLWLSGDIPLEYVILGGDDEVVPERGVFGRVGSTVDNRMPSDLYFSNLDGNWNANGNDVYGEMQDQTDMIPELHIGRFPAETLWEFNNIFRKIRYYVDHDSFSNNIAIFYGENLNNNPLTWGADYKDDVAQYLPDGYMYSTQYQRDGTYSSSSVWNSINNGVNVMNHMGHANETYLMGQGNNTINQLQNTEYGFLYSQGCYPAAFDQRTSGDGECIGEHLLMASGGVFAFIGNTRYGWYMPGSIEGASQFYDREFFIGLYEQNHLQLGDALTYSRLQNLNSALSNDVMRWCYMEMILFGDPSVAVKLPNPELPMLVLESYEFDDGLGDGDGTINPGETIRLYPVVRNAEGWGTAYDVSIRLVAAPPGMELLEVCLMVGQLEPGESTPEDMHFMLEMPQELNFGTYTLRLAVESFDPLNNLSTGIKYYDVTFDVTLLDARFPWETPNAGKSAPIVGDFNGDGSNDILYLDVFGIAYLIGSDGEEFAGFQSPDELNVFRSTAMGQIDNLGGDDLVITSRTGKIIALNMAGELIFSYNAETSFVFSPVLADFTGDGNNEVIATGLDGNLYVIDNQGMNAPGFPLYLGSTVQVELAVGRLSAAGPMQIVAGTGSGELKVIGPGGVINQSYAHNLGAGFTGSPVILDNGKVAIGTNNTMYLVGPAGIEFQKTIDAPMAGGMIIADLNRDSSLDLLWVSNSGMLWAVAQSGENLPGFPVVTNTSFSCPPLVADIDGDFQYEILLHNNNNSLYAYNHDGSPVSGFPFGTSYNGATPGTLVDFDNDGYFKLVTGFSNGILMSNLRRTASALAPWTTYRGSLSRQASFAATGYVDNADANQSPALDKLKQNYPNPFNPNTTITFSLAKAQHSSLDIFNIRGQKVRNLVNAQLPAGSHTLAWDATDDHGRILPSGLYFYRLQGENSSQTRKMLLLK
jgi:hypothetical protein